MREKARAEGFILRRSVEQEQSYRGGGQGRSHSAARQSCSPKSSITYRQHRHY